MKVVGAKAFLEDFISDFSPLGNAIFPSGLKNSPFVENMIPSH